MPRHEIHRVVPYTPAQMFAIVADVESYPQFVPYCAQLRLLSREKVDEDCETLIATMTVRYKIFEERYTSRIAMNRATSIIDVGFVSGPFKRLTNSWSFEKAGEGACIHFVIDYEFRSNLLSFAMGRVFEKLFGGMERAFEMRAASLYAK